MTGRRHSAAPCYLSAIMPQWRELVVNRCGGHLLNYTIVMENGVGM